MKFFKKVIPVFLSVSLLSIIPTFGSAQFPDLTKIEEDYYVGIKKVERVNGKLVSKNIKDPSGIYELPDGIYVLNRGTGWVLGEDASLLTSSIVSKGTSSTVSTTKSMSTTHTAITGATATLNFEFVKASIDTTYRYNVSSDESIAAGFTVSAPADKDVYVKLYATYNRFDTIKVEGGKIVEHTSTYSPEGTWAKITKYTPGETLNLSKLEEKVTRCVLGENPLNSIVNSITIGGTTYNGALKESAFKLSLDYNAKEILFSNRTEDSIHAGYKDKEYFKFSLLDSNLNEKSSFSFKGLDKPNNSKFNALNELNFEFGDYILLEHKEPFRVKINGDGTTEIDWTEGKSLLKITDEGLEKADISLIKAKSKSIEKVKDNDKLQPVEEVKENDKLPQVEEIQPEENISY